jgi:hypothetical protein
MRVVGNRGLILALIGIGLVLATTPAAYRPATPLEPDAPGGGFSAHRAKSILRPILIQQRAASSQEGDLTVVHRTVSL